MQIQVALASFGMSGKVFHAPFLHIHPNFNLYACVERSQKNIQQYYPATKSFSDFEIMLTDENLQLVIINTPNTTHFDLATKALLAGKHIVVEKPFTVTTEEADQLMALAAKQQLEIFVFHNRRYDSDFITVKQIIQQGLLGSIVECEIHFDRFSQNVSNKLHKEIPVKGTGVLYDLGSHIIDQALQLFGMPKAVLADIFAMRSVSKVDDYFELLLYYPNKRVRLKASYLVKEQPFGYMIHGTEGSFIKPKTNVQENDLTSGLLPQLINNNWGKEDEKDWGILNIQIDGKERREKFPSLQGNYMQFYTEVYNCLVHKHPSPVSAIEGKMVIQLIEAAYKSVTNGTIVHL